MKKIIVFIGVLLWINGWGSVKVEEIYPSSTVQDDDVVVIKWSSTESGDYRIEVGGNGTQGTGVLIYDRAEGTINADTTVYTYLYPVTDFTEGDGDYNVYIYVTAEGDSSPEYTVLKFVLDNVPETPTNFSASPGDGVLFLNWDDHPDRDLKRFEIYWREGEESEEPVTSPSISLYADYVKVDPTATSYTLSGLENGKVYFLSIRAVDEGDKASPLSAEIKAIPMKTYGVSNFADEEVGCMFTYFHPEGNFTIARRIKSILKKTGWGVRLLHFYYTKFSPYVINHAQKNKSIYLMAKGISLVAEDGVMLTLLVLFFLPLMRFRKKMCLLAVIFVFGIPDSVVANSPRRFTLVMYGTNYYPSRFPEVLRWDDVYGKGGHFLFEGEFGWEYPTKGGIPGISIQGGIFREKGYGLVEENGTYVRGSKDHEFYIFPLRVNIFYRFEFIEDQYVVPFVKGGVSFMFFMEKITDGGVQEQGRVNGFHWSAGVLLPLDWIDKEHARKLDGEWGINETFIWVEYMFQYVGRKDTPWGEKTVYDFTSRNLYIGLGFDF